MASQSDYYGNVDLRYAEVGIAMQKIDRMNPGMVKFSIPTLTPGMSDHEDRNDKIIQKDKTNIANDNTDAVDVSNIEIGNTLLIDLPAELCALPGAYYDITGSYTSDQDITSDGAIEIQGSIKMTGRSRTDGSLTFNGNITGSPKTNGISGASFSGNGSVNGAFDASGTGTMVGRILHNTTRGDIDVRKIEGTVGLTLNEKSRYIEEGSRWLIMFVGGDISTPVVVCRLPTKAATPVTEEYIEVQQEKQENGEVEVNNNEYDTDVPDQNKLDPEYEERDLTPWEYEVTEPDTTDNVVEVSLTPASVDDIWNLDNVFLTSALPTKITNTAIKENDQVVFTPLYEYTLSDQTMINKKEIRRDKMYNYIMDIMKYVDVRQFVLNVWKNGDKGVNVQIRYDRDLRSNPETMPVESVTGSIAFIDAAGQPQYAYPVTLTDFNNAHYWDNNFTTANGVKDGAYAAFIPIYEKTTKSDIDPSELEVKWFNTENCTIQAYDKAVEITYKNWPNQVNRFIGTIPYFEYKQVGTDSDGDPIYEWVLRNVITDVVLSHFSEDKDQRAKSHKIDGSTVTVVISHDDMVAYDGKNNKGYKTVYIPTYEFNSNPDPIQKYTYEAYDIKAADFTCTTIDGSALINIKDWPKDVDAIFGKFVCGDLTIDSQKLVEASTKVENEKIKAGTTATFTPTYQVNNANYGHPLRNADKLKFDTFVTDGQIILQQTNWPSDSAYFVGKIEVMPEGYVPPKKEDTGVGEVTEWYIYNADIMSGVNKFEDERITMFDRVYFTPIYTYPKEASVTTADVTDKEKEALTKIFGDKVPGRGVHFDINGKTMYLKTLDNGTIIYTYDHDNKKYLKCTVVNERQDFNADTWDKTYLKIFVTDGYTLIEYEDWPKEGVYKYRGCITCIRNGRKKAIEENNDNDYPVKNWNDDDVEYVVGDGFCVVQYNKNWPADTGRFEGRLHVKRTINNGTKLIENDILKQTIHINKNNFKGNFLFGDEVKFIPKYEFPKKPATAKGNDHPVTDWNRVYCTCTCADGYVDIKYTKFPKEVSRYVGCLSVMPGKYESESFMIYNVPLRDENTRIYDSRIESIDRATFDPVYQYPRGSTDFYLYNIDIGADPVKILDNRFTDKDLIYFTCVYQYTWVKVEKDEKVPEGTETKEVDGVKYKLVQGKENEIDKYDKTKLSIFPQVGKITLSYKDFPSDIAKFRGSLAIETNGNRDYEERVMNSAEKEEQAKKDDNHWYVYNFDLTPTTKKYEDDRISMYDAVYFTFAEEYAATADNAKNRTVWNWDPKNVNIVVQDGQIDISYAPWPNGVDSFVGSIVINSINLDVPEWYIYNAKLVNGVATFKDSKITARDSVTYVVSYEYDTGYDKKDLPAESKWEGSAHYRQQNVAIFVTDGYFLADYKAFPKGISKFRGCISVNPNGNKEAILAGKKMNYDETEIVNIETNKATTTVNPINSVASRSKITDSHKFIADVYINIAGGTSEKEVTWSTPANVSQRFIEYDVISFIPAPWNASAYKDNVKITLMDGKVTATFINWSSKYINGKIVLTNRYKEFSIDVELPNYVTTVYDDRIDEDYVVEFTPTDDKVKEAWGEYDYYLKRVSKGQVVIWLTYFPDTDTNKVKGTLTFRKLMKLKDYDTKELKIPTYEEIGREIPEINQTTNLPTD